MGMSEARAVERDKYTTIYGAMPNYRMGAIRMRDAVLDLQWAAALGCLSYLDIGCGRGEMLEHADALGFSTVNGCEIVPDLCGGRVWQCAVDKLHTLPGSDSGAGFDFVTSFDVIEHLLPGDDEALVREMGRVAVKCLALTANNRPSVDPATGADLHINKRAYDEWDSLIRSWLPGWTVTRCGDKEYVSETWRAER